MSTVYIRDVSSGRIHAGSRRGDQLLTDEADNLDDAGARIEISLAEAMVSEDLCLRCFPNGEVIEIPAPGDV